MHVKKLLYQREPNNEMNVAIMISTYPADQNIKNHLITRGFEEKKEIAGYKTYTWKNLTMYETEAKTCLELENIDKEIEADLFVFATIHQSASKHPCLTCHPIGNWDKAEHGGNERTIYQSSAAYWKMFYLRLKELSSDIDITLEATHHGPHVEKPTLFVEIGSGEEQWNDPKFGDILAECIMDVFTKEPIDVKACIVLGGGHYNSAVMKLFEQSDWSVGHVCPKFMLETLDEDTLRQAIDNTIPKAEMVALDHKGLGSSREKVKELLDRMNIPYDKARNLYNKKE